MMRRSPASSSAPLRRQRLIFFGADTPRSSRLLGALRLKIVRI